MPKLRLRPFKTALALTILASAAVPVRQALAQTSTLSDDVQVQARVSYCIVDLKVHPEKRLPRVGNWDSILTVQIYTLSNQLYAQYSGESSMQEGRLVVNLCDLGYNNLQPGFYRLYVRGYSHLRRYFGVYRMFDFNTTTIDLTGGGRILWAGETSNAYDNYINSLDLVTQVNAIWTLNDYKNDLNQDTEVNSLEIGNTIDNFYMNGD